jgi:cytidine deaminase
LSKLEQADVVKTELIRAAAYARDKAYSPYSHFRVGASVLATSGKIYTGCNVENASFSLTICAERLAIANAISAGEREIVAVAIMSEGQANPCGACLQVMQEFAGDDPPIIITSDLEGHYVMRSLAECLPFGFKQFESES